MQIAQLVDCFNRTAGTSAYHRAIVYLRGVCLTGGVGIGKMTKGKDVACPMGLKELELVFNSLNSLVVVQDLEHNILHVNDNVCEALDKPRDQIIGKRCHELFGEVSSPCDDCPIPRAIETKEPAGTKKQTPDGRWWRIWCRPIVDDAGELTRILEISEDITETVKAKEARQRVESQLALILDTMNEMFAFYSTDLRILWVNKTAARSAGYTMEDLAGKHCYEVFHERLAPCIDCPVKRCMESGKAEMGEVVAKSGREYLLRAYPVFEEDGAVTGAFEYGVDITEQNRTNRALRRAVGSFDEIAKAGNIGLFNWDFKSNEVEYSTQWKRQIGYKEEEITSSLSEWQSRLHPDDLDRVLQEVQLCVKELHQEFKTEFRFRHRNGNYLWILATGSVFADEQGEAVNMRGTHVDITDRKEMENALAESEARYRSIMEAMDDAIYICSPELKIEYANKAMEKIIGPSKVGTHCYEAIYGSKEQCEFCDISTVLAGNIARAEHHLPSNGKDYSVAKTPLRHADGSISALTVYRDITDMKSMEKRLKQAQKMESIGSLAGGIAHDFNNLLVPIVSMSELLLEDLPENSECSENAQLIFDAALRGRELVKQILAFSREAKQALVPIKLQKVLNDVHRLCRSTIPSNIEIKMNVQSSCGFVLSDATQMHQICMNLITNAYHALEDGQGKIAVSLTEVNNPTIKGQSLLGRYAKLSIEDNGCGISTENLERIFDPYFTTKSKEKGTGLGLSVVYGIVKEYQGEIFVTSKVAEGTTFTIFLPIMKRSANKSKKLLQQDLRSGTERILLIDDEPNIVKLEKHLLERLGYRVTALTSSVEALATFKEQPTEFDLVLTDVSMPGMTGDELAKEILAIRKNIPIIMCTGFSERMDQEKAKAMGVRGFAMKPMLRGQMAKLIREILDE